MKLEKERENVLIKTLLKESLYNSLAQAIVKILQTPHYTLKLLLSLFVLATSCLASFLVIKSILDYFSYQVITTTRTIHEMPTEFPKITICNLNKYATKYAWEYVTNDTQKKGEEALANEEKRLLGHDLNDTLFDCWFNFQQCDSRDFIWSFDSTNGNCFSFNSGFDANGTRVDLKKSRFVGSVFGLQMTLYINIYEEFKTSFQKDYNYNSLAPYNLDSGLGAIIRIENSSYLKEDKSFDGILITPGFITNIVLNRFVRFTKITMVRSTNVTTEKLLFLKIH
jgi:hypothetical protein